MVPAGKVYAVDVEPRHGAVPRRAREEGEAREPDRRSTAPRAIPRLPEKADLVVLVDVYHHIEQRERYFRALAASLKPGGRVAVIDFRMDSPSGPPKSARVAPERVKAELAAAGYALAEEHGFLPRQYFLVFTRT